MIEEMEEMDENDGYISEWIWFHFFILEFVVSSDSFEWLSFGNISCRVACLFSFMGEVFSYCTTIESMP